MSEKLIKLLEEATEPNHNLDVAIAEAIGWFAAHPNEHRAPDFTSSIDAALTLVPKYYRAIVCTDPRMAAVTDVNQDDHWYEPELHYSPVRAATPVIALCIAALKARL